MKKSFKFQSAFTIYLICFFVFSAFCQAQTTNIGTNYHVGYREFKSIDSSRRYKTGAAIRDPLFYRPEEIDVWYPAESGSKDAPLNFSYFVYLFERRANTFQDSIKYDGLADELMQHFTVEDSSVAVKTVNTKSHLDAKEIKGHFPLLVYMCSFNGMSYENIPLFENLASHGYIVVSVSSIGRYPGNMTTSYPDLIEQVKDADFAIKYMCNRNVDSSKIGLIGYSYGGLAANVLALHHAAIKALLSLDGSEMHYYGKGKKEDADFNELLSDNDLKHSPLMCPYSYLESDHKLDEGIPDSVYRILNKANIKIPYIRLLNYNHEDFSDLAHIGTVKSTPYELVNQLTLNYFEQYLGDKKSAYDLAADGVLSSKKGLATFAKIITGNIDTLSRLNLKGKIISAEAGSSIPYVSIGIPAGNCGTVSDENGLFVLNVEGALVNNIIRISSLGYQSKNFTVKELALLLKQGTDITLTKQNKQLSEVIIKAKKLRIKTVGNTSQSKFFSVGFPLKFLGSEVGVVVSLGKKDVLLRSFNFNISQTRLDSCTFRLNIYSLANGLPSKNLLANNLLISIGNKPGSYTIDLKSQRLLMKNKIFISLEWISGKTTNKQGAVFFSAGLLASSYHRKTTEANWEQFKGLGAGFNLQVEESEE